MDFKEKYLKDTIFAINFSINKKIFKVTTKSIRKILKIKSNNRSAINFVSRSLKDLSEMKKIKYLDNTSPKKYLLPQVPIKTNDSIVFKKKISNISDRKYKAEMSQ